MQCILTCRAILEHSYLWNTVSLLSMSCKQKLVIKSSTKAQLVSVSDGMSFVMQAGYLFQEKARFVPENSKLKERGINSIVQQDNTIEIQLECNSKRLITNKTSHITIRYFCATNKVKSVKASVVYKPTRDMVSDFFPKLL